MSGPKAPEKYARSRERNAARRQERRAVAEARQRRRETRSALEQLRILDARPGDSARERARLQAEIARWREMVA